MNRLIVFGCAVLLFSGCQELSRNKSKSEVIIKGGGEFPEFLVGKWRDKDREEGWEFVFEPDGTLSSAVVAIDAAKLTAGKTTRYTIKGRGKAVFKPGYWVVEYEPETRELEVQVVIDYFYLDWGKDAWEGSSTDIFTGSASQNGEELEMEWYSFPKIVLYIGSTGERFELPPDDPNDSSRGPLVFTKVVSEK